MCRTPQKFFSSFPTGKEKDGSSEKKPSLIRLLRRGKERVLLTFLQPSLQRKVIYIKAVMTRIQHGQMISLQMKISGGQPQNDEALAFLEQGRAYPLRQTRNGWAFLLTAPAGDAGGWACIRGSGGEYLAVGPGGEA